MTPPLLQIDCRLPEVRSRAGLLVPAMPLLPRSVLRLRIQGALSLLLGAGIGILALVVPVMIVRGDAPPAGLIGMVLLLLVAAVLCVGGWRMIAVASAARGREVPSTPPYILRIDDGPAGRTITFPFWYAGTAEIWPLAQTRLEIVQTRMGEGIALEAPGQKRRAVAARSLDRSPAEVIAAVDALR